MGLFLGHIYQDSIPDLIFVRGEGTPLFSTSYTGGLSTQFVDRPASYEIGDRLLCIATGDVQGPISPTSNFWTILTSFSGGQMRVSQRVAVGSSSSPHDDDRYSVLGVSAALSSPAWHLQMIALASLSPGTVTWSATGLEVSGGDEDGTSDFTLDEIAVGPDPSNTFVLGVYSRDWAQHNVGTEPSIDVADGLSGFNHMHCNTHHVSFPAQTAMHISGWGGVFQKTSALIASQQVGYTPAGAGSPGGAVATRSRYYRFKLVPP